MTFRDTGHVVLSTAVTHARAPEALRLILAELEQVTREPLGDEELERGKRSLLSRLSTSYEGPIAATATIADLVIEGVTDRRVLAGAIRGLGAEEVRRVAARYFDPTQLQIVVVADASTLQVPLRALGVGPISVE